MSRMPHKISPHSYSLSEVDLTSYDERNEKPDVVPLKKSEVWAWYIQNATYCGYGWVAGSLIVPLLIQDAASRIGVEVSDPSLPCNTTVPHFKCVTPFFGHYLDPGTISLYISSLSSIASFFCSLSISAVADHGLPHLFWVSAILSPLGWTFFNICGVFSHSYLPIYGRVHPNVLASQAQGDSQKVTRKIEEQAINDLSAYSVGIANVGAVIIHGVCIGISLLMNESMLSLQIAIAFTGAWWFMWMLIIAPWLDARPGPPMPKGKNWIAYSWGKTYKTLTAFRQLPEIFKFMLAWFVLSDGINTIPAIFFIILYRELGFSHSHSLIISVMLAVMACVGAYFFLGIRKLWKMSTRAVILLVLFLYGVLLAYLIITPYVTRQFGLRQAWEGWAVTAYIGLIISTFYGCMRVMLSELCPEGDENEWFSLYLLADKGSSWVGPFVTGWIYTMTGDYRHAFWFPMALVILGVLILCSVNMDKGKDEARRFADEKETRRRTGHEIVY
ncbi:Autophagy protein 22 [Podila epigama]|nr:Autophagy protein 22 [Podila epigama]